MCTPANDIGLSMHTVCMSREFIILSKKSTASLTALWFQSIINDNLSAWSDHSNWLNTTVKSKIREEILIWTIFTYAILVDNDGVCDLLISLVERQDPISHTIIVSRRYWMGQ